MNQSLTDSGVPNPLANPTLTLFDSNGNVKMTNDDWRDSPDATEISNTGIPPKNDRESAYERLKGRAAEATPTAGSSAPGASGGGWMDSLKGSLGGLMTGSGRKDSVVEAMAKSAARTVGSTVGREIVRGVLGSLLGGGRRR